MTSYVEDLERFTVQDDGHSSNIGTENIFAKTIEGLRKQQLSDAYKNIIHLLIFHLQPITLNIHLPNQTKLLFSVFDRGFRKIIAVTILVKLVNDWPPYRLFHNPSQWRHNECDGLSNHQFAVCLIVYSNADKKIKSPRHWPLWGLSTGERWIPSQITNNAENISIWWRHHALCTA